MGDASAVHTPQQTRGIQKIGLVGWLSHVHRDACEVAAREPVFVITNESRDTVEAIQCSQSRGLTS